MKRNNSWKYKKWTGGNRKRVLNEYRNIQNSIVNERELPQQIVNLNFVSGQARAFSDTLQLGSVNKYNAIEENSGDENWPEITDLGDDDNSSSHSLNTSNEVEEMSEYMKNIDFRDKLRNWAIAKNISQAALKDLSLILNERFNNILPNDPRTLLQTPKEVTLKEIEDNGEYWHHGVSSPLKRILENLIDLPETIHLNFNFDGLPIHKSSKKEFWPILANIFEIDVDPFIIGIYFGTGKPKKLHSYLEDFVTEMKKILEEGIHINGKNIFVKIRCFICDSPARAFIKGVCNFNGKHGCLKCTTVGEYSHETHTVTFSSRQCPERNDHDFRAKNYGAHHKADSPLLNLPIDMVKDFPVADSLHLIDLGITKRLLVGWRDGNFGNYVTKWCARDIEKVNNFLSKCKMPFEIHRAVRTLDCLAHWKASEFRTFLYYLSVIILRVVLRDDVFENFVAFFCAITICSIEKYHALLSIAKELLQCFVDQFKDFYGANYMTSNVHNLMHVVDEVERFGPLPTFNAYSFENKLFQIKKMLRQGNKPLSQVAKRLSEESKNNNYSNMKKNVEFTEPYLTEHQKRKILHFKHFVLSAKAQDKYCMLNNQEIVEIKDISSDESKVINISGFQVVNKCDIFQLPIKSSHLNMFKAEDQSEMKEGISITPGDILCKLVTINYNNARYFLPLLHTI